MTTGPTCSRWIRRCIGRTRLTHEVTDPRFDTPTTLARHGNMLYLTNAHFYAADPANTDYAITAIPDPA